MKLPVLAVTIALLGAAHLALGQPPEFTVVVNAENPTTRLTSEMLTKYFLNRSARWGHGPEIAPVDQSAKSAIRDLFTRRVMGRTVDSVVNHWKERMMGAREAPPPVKGSDSAVIEYVAKNKNAIGYVTPAATLPPTVKAIVVTD
jgi:ABC-type phosphate transport system substrate-binding protein